MIVRNNQELEKLKEIGHIVAVVRDRLMEMVEPGLMLKTLDDIAKTIFDEYDAKSAPIFDYDFPGQVCISLNEVAAHGIPDDTVIRAGDLVNIDVSALKDGFYADTGATKIAGMAINPIHVKLLDVSKKALIAGISQAKVDNRVYHIGQAIHETAKSENFKVIKNLMGHGIGRALHEAPNEISNYKVLTENQKLKNGHVLAIETFISLNDEWVTQGNDEWALVTKSGNRTAQFEHTIVICETGPIIITEK